MLSSSAYMCILLVQHNTHLTSKTRRLTSKNDTHAQLFLTGCPSSPTCRTSPCATTPFTPCQTGTVEPLATGPLLMHTPHIPQAADVPTTARGPATGPPNPCAAAPPCCTAHGWHPNLPQPRHHCATCTRTYAAPGALFADHAAGPRVSHRHATTKGSGVSAAPALAAGLPRS